LTMRSDFLIEYCPDQRVRDRLMSHTPLLVFLLGVIAVGLRVAALARTHVDQVIGEALTAISMLGFIAVLARV
jgi:hypothetical protein